MTRLALNPLLSLSSSLRLTPQASADSPMVLHVRVVAGSGGGPDKTILRSAGHIDPSAMRMAAAYIHPHDDPGFEVLRGHAKTFGCPLHEVPESGAVDLRTIRQLLQICEQQRVTVWHGHDYKSDLIGLILRKFRPMKLVTTVHGFTRETARTRLYYHIDNWCLRRYDQVIAVSPLLMQHCLDHGVSADKLTYVPNGIDPTEFKRQRDTIAARTRLNMNPDTTNIGVVGRLSIEKGVDRAIHALAAIRENNHEVQMHIVGDGPQRSTLEKLASELNVKDNVIFHGWQKDSHLFYESMDSLLLPSHTEGCPNVVLEAMAMGVPVAATNVGNVSELLDNGKCGIILPDDHTQWPTQMAMMLRSEPWRRVMARAARNRVKQQYTFEHRMQRVLGVYDRLLKVSPAERRLREAA